MNLCSRFHDEVCFDLNKCPVCAIIEEKDNEIESLKDNVRNLQGEVDDLNALAYPST